MGDLVGGSHLSALGLIRHLDPSRFEALVVLHRTNGRHAELLREEGIAFETAPSAEPLERGEAPRTAMAVARFGRSVLLAARFLRQRGVAIVHTNDGRMHISWGLAARLAGTKLLWHQRGDPTAFGARRVAPWIAHRMLSVSRFSIPPPGILSVAGRCRVVHSPFDVEGLDLDRSPCRARLVAELGCPAETRLLGCVGALIDRKRPLVFVDTIAAMCRDAPDLPVLGLFFGDALDQFDQAVRARAAEHGISDRIHLMGFRYPGAPWLAALDALLVPAVGEPFGRTLIEAMLLGTPVIAANSGGTPEAIRDHETGRLVPPDQPEAMARAALELMHDPDQARALALAARADARARFGIERHASAVMQAYDELLEC